MTQRRLLFQNAWRRFTRPEGLARDSDPRSVLVLAAIAFAMPGIMLAFVLAFPLVIGFRIEMVDARPSLHELAYYSGLLVALAALLEWDALLPDAADAAVLAPLPVPPRRLAVAHVKSLAALLAVLTVVVNAGSVVLIPLLDWTGQSFLAGCAHQVEAVIATAGIAFGAVLILRALAMACHCLPGLQWLGPGIQALALVCVISALLLLPWFWDFAQARHALIEAPESLAGWAAVIVLAGCTSYGLAARHSLRHPRGRARRRPSAPASAERRLPLSPSAAAVAIFAARTALRCRRQRMIVAAWFALGASVALIRVVGGGRLPVGRHRPGRDRLLRTRRFSQQFRGAGGTAGQLDLPLLVCRR